MTIPTEKFPERDAVIRACESAFRRFHSAEFIHPDPLEIVREESNPGEREVVALVAAAFSLGRVSAILSTVRMILNRLREDGGGSVRSTLLDLPFERLRDRFADFVYRFFGPDQLAGFLAGIGSVLRANGSIENCFLTHDRFAKSAGDSPAESSDYRAALSGLVGDILAASPVPFGILLPDPRRGSASKRLHLFLRWLVRSDNVDPGGWNEASASRLLVPMDTHMLRISRQLGITRRTTADARASDEVTSFFRSICRDDPVRYDFSLTRFGIHPEVRREALLS